MRLQVRRLDERAQLPTRAHDGDAGLDLYALEDAQLGPGARAQVRTGIAVEIPPGHAGLVLPRSGLAARHGIALVNAPGLIDAGYRGEIRVLLLNTDRTGAYTVSAGDRHSCGLSAAGTVYCWGSNKYAQLGNGTKVTSDVPVLVVR